LVSPPLILHTYGGGFVAPQSEKKSGLKKIILKMKIETYSLNYIYEIENPGTLIPDF
jgi:hypothetical protein